MNEARPPAHDASLHSLRLSLAAKMLTKQSFAFPRLRRGRQEAQRRQDLTLENRFRSGVILLDADVRLALNFLT